MPMKKHPHPGRIVRQDFLEPLGLTVTEAAQVLGVARQTINNLVNEKVGISTEMAVRLSKAFGPSPDMWVRLQADYDLSLVSSTTGRNQCCALQAGFVNPGALNTPHWSKRANADGNIGKSGLDRLRKSVAYVFSQHPCLVRLPPSTNLIFQISIERQRLSLRVT